MRSPGATRRGPAVALVAALVTASLSAPAAATSAPAADEPGPGPTAPATISFGVQPANAAGGVDDRALFQYDLAPQTTVFDYVGAVNYGDAPLELSVYATDAGTDGATGSFSPATRAATPRDVGAWIDVGDGAPTVTVPAAGVDGPGTAVLPLTITVPSDATPGDHAGAIIAASTATGENPQGRVRLEQRVAVRVYLRVAGELAPGLTLSGLVATYRQPALPWSTGSVDVRYRVANDGNVRLGLQPSILVRGTVGAGERRVTPAPLAELLPGATTELRETVGGVRSLNGVAVTVRLEAIASPGTQPPGLAPVTASVTDLAVPWSLLVVVVAVVALLAFVVVRRRRVRPGDADLDT